MGTDSARTNELCLLRPGQPTDIDTIRCTLNEKANGNVNGYHNWALLGVHIQGDVATGEKLNLH